QSETLAMIDKRVRFLFVALISLIVCSGAIAVLYTSLNRPVPFDEATAKRVLPGMTLPEVRVMLGPEGWHAGSRFTRTCSFNTYRKYFPTPNVFAPVPSVDPPPREIRKGWANDHGAILVTFKDGRVIAVLYCPVFETPLLF